MSAASPEAMTDPRRAPVFAPMSAVDALDDAALFAKIA
jgi:hypothetical protein